jgi:hypothetical protein
MPASSFDPDAPHGTVTPHEYGAAYYQNGRHFDVNYNEIEWGTGRIIATYAKPEIKVKAKVKQTKPRASDTAFKGMSFDKPPEAEPEAQAIDLEAWAEGKAKHPWFSVKAEIMKQFDREPENSTEGRKIVLGEE